MTIVLTLTPEDDPGFPDVLRALGNAHTERFWSLGDKDDVDKAIEYKSAALKLIPDNNPNLALQLVNLATSHRDRFERLGDLIDMGKAIEYNSRAVAITAEDDPNFPNWLAELGISYQYRFGSLGELEDLTQAVEYQSRALALTPDGHPHFLTRLTNLGVSHKERFGRLGDLHDLEQAIEYQSRALALTPDGHPHLGSLLGNLAVSYKDRFGRLGELHDLEQCIEYESRALALTPDGHPHLPIRLGNLAVSYRERFGRLGELPDLEQAISYQSRALALTPDGHPDMTIHLGNLAVSYKERFGRLGELSDMEQSIACQSRAVALTSDGHPELPSRLGNLAVYYKERFGRLGKLSDLEQAIEHESRALALTPDGHPELPRRLGNIAVSYSEQFRRLGDLPDLEQTIAYQFRALDLTPESHPELPSRLGNLAVSYGERFGRLGQLQDLEQAIKHEANVLAIIPSDHPHSCLWHFNHAKSYLTYYNHSHDPSHLHQALASFRDASISSAGSPRLRFENAQSWASYACKHSVLNPIEACQAAIDLLPQFIWLGTTADQRYHDLKSIQTLAVDAAHAAIISSNYSLALEWLEHARCVAWNQNLMLRSPLDQLLDSHPALATRLQGVASELHAASSNSRESLARSRSITLEQVAQDHRRLAQEYEDLLTQARIQPGFEDFLRPMKAAGLMRAARNGPVVVINCHEQRCDAITVLPSHTTIGHLSLPSFNSKKAQDAHSTIRSILRRKGIRERGVSLRKKPERHNDSEFRGALMMLWTDVVKPVLEFLALTTHDPGARLPHITWCPTRAASFLPLHAAGDYSQPAGSRVFDYVVSSYTPTLTALLTSPPSTLSCNSQVLAIGQANTPGHNQLPGTTAELKLVRMHVEGRAKYSELTDAQATPTTVLDAMEQHDWVHLACHAHQNLHDPTKSGFFLHDGTLDLAAINRRSFNKKGLAFLSACQTATGDETLPNEAVHLASGMLMAGYSSVIATMWSVGDAEAPLVADKVYSQLMKTGALGNGEAGRALHDAVAGLRSSIGEKEFGRWVPFIHIGS
ncbi:unnamed protein product [Rhizoctonia solani]|uniref:CHAT domain-containing protein n=1 Tax=Rhizoctonia solani TaxID=456999 RepID=A0A8H3HVR4_9AGAM|nr:unnamed protein product [Rhizoctonia solani]